MHFRRVLGGALATLVFISMTTNLLTLAGPLFMLQVYDRVLASRSLPTLGVLVILITGVYAFYGLLDAIRGRMTARLANSVEHELGVRLFRMAVRLRIGLAGTSPVDPVKDGDTVRSFLAGPGPLAFLDLPWVPLYLGVLFLVHPLLGWLSTAGAVVSALLMVASEFALRRPAEGLTAASARRLRALEDARNNAEVVLGMGMQEALERRWERLSAELLTGQRASGDRSYWFSSSSKAIRLLLQSLVLAVGAYLVIGGEMTGGLMIAASVLTSKALTPIEQTVAQWKSFLGARQAYRRLRKYLAIRETARETTLPLPRANLSVRQASAGPPGTQRPVLLTASFELNAGDTLGIIGPSGAGKTSLARTLLGLWPLSSGEVRFDGSMLAHYGSDQLSEIVGYLPQRIDLFEGTVAQNIARFGLEADSDAVIRAARLADVHDLISSLPDGYDTEVGPQGDRLSAGQRQRIGLARALFGDPFLCLLDEPNSNLDAEGDVALTAAIRGIQQRGGIAIVIAHRPSAVAAVDKLLFMRGGGGRSHLGPRRMCFDRCVATMFAN